MFFTEPYIDIDKENGIDRSSDDPMRIKLEPRDSNDDGSSSDANERRNIIPENVCDINIKEEPGYITEVSSGFF